MTKKTFRIISFVIAFTISLTIVSCKKSESSSVNSSLIVGTWKSTSRIHYYPYMGYNDTMLNLDQSSPYYCEASYTANGVVYSSNYYATQLDTSNYTIVNDKLIETHKNGTKDTAIIQVLNSTNLKLDFHFTDYTGAEDKIYTFTK